jgi:hypothetical protein
MSERYIAWYFYWGESGHWLDESSVNQISPHIKKNLRGFSPLAKITDKISVNIAIARDRSSFHFWL